MASSAVEVRQHATKGRGLYATKAFAPGAVILAFTPALLVPSVAHIQTMCSHCFKVGTPKACSRCHAAAYCDAACQTAAWTAVHSKECKVLRKSAEQGRPGLPAPVRAAIQALVKPRVAAALEGLEGNVEALRKHPKWPDVQLMAMGACGFAGLEVNDDNVGRVAEYLCKARDENRGLTAFGPFQMQINGFERFSADFGALGIFLEPTLAMANHSCLPNAMVQFAGRKAVLRAEASIKAGDEIEICYTDPTAPLSRRRAGLESYNFTCQCLRCSQDLNVYQAAAISPIIDLNLQGSLVSDPSKLRNHPAATDTEKAKIVAKAGQDLAHLAEGMKYSVPISDHRNMLAQRYQQCERLVREDAWAITPLPEILGEIATYYFGEGNFAYGLAVSCLMETCCTPYRYVAPFNPLRARGAKTIAKLVTVTAPDSWAMASDQSAGTAGASSRGSLRERLDEVLLQIDQVSLCQILLITVVDAVPQGFEPDWEQNGSSAELLEGITQLEGREQENSIINSWRANPASEQSRAFWDFAVVQPMQSLANLGKEILEADFGTA